MLKTVKTKTDLRDGGGRFAIVASRYNSEYVDAMVCVAQMELERAGVSQNAIQIIRVPGAFEIPAVAAKLADIHLRSKKQKPSAILCFGVIFQGETSHAEHIGKGVTHALAQIQILYKIPVIHGVFVFEKEKQAKIRCLGKKHNRGTEAAQTALEMARVMKNLSLP